MYRLHLTLFSWFCLLMGRIGQGDSNLWAEWWTYQGLSGPAYWGLLNPHWVLCSKGRNQSPIDVDPATLLFDPSLAELKIDGDVVTGWIRNNGHDLTLSVEERRSEVRFREGPLSYIYRVAQLRLHFSDTDDEGSEHSIHNKTFPLEIHVMAYNTDLYYNLSIAERSPRGMVILAVFAQVSDQDHQEFSVLTKALNKTRFKGDTERIGTLRLSKLLPPTEHYVTYEGSLTYPGCYETVTWVILNKPIYVGKAQMAVLRSLNEAGRENPQTKISGNFRPRMPVNQRTVRTNINFSPVHDGKKHVLQSKREVNGDVAPTTEEVRSAGSTPVPALAVLAASQGLLMLIAGWGRGGRMER